MKKKKEKPNILITGSLGHIGSYLIHNKDFVKCFNQIYLIDNLSAERYVSLFNLPKYGNFSFFNIDLPNHFVKMIVKKSDIVLHLAATTNAEASVNLKGKQKKKNFLSTIEVANLCCKYNKKERCRYSSPLPLEKKLFLLVFDSAKLSDLHILQKMKM